MGAEFRFDAFLCHSSEDHEVVRALAGTLRGHGFDVWLDEEQGVRTKKGGLKTGWCPATRAASGSMVHRDPARVGHD